MEEKVLSSSSPLYGRRSRDLHLKQLRFKYAKEFLKMSFEDSLKTFFSIGGVPEYLLKAGEYKTFTEFVSKEFLSKYGYFYNEPYFLLSREFKEIKTYFSILNAIAFGNTEPSKIANFVGIKTREIYPYLENLIRYGFVKREVNIFSPKRGTYLISDPLFDFWFNFVYKHREKIELGTLDPKNLDFNQYFGKRFEMFVREEIFPEIWKTFTKLGKWWYKDKEIDIIALNENTKEILFCECKWSDNVDAMKVTKDLYDKSRYVQWNNEDRKEYFAIFAKSFKRKIEEFEGRKVYCFDLRDVEQSIVSKHS
jgi:AAA+ ATPase superfamily predicted ATPase